MRKQSSIVGGDQSSSHVPDRNHGIKGAISQQPFVQIIRIQHRNRSTYVAAFVSQACSTWSSTIIAGPRTKIQPHAAPAGTNSPITTSTHFNDDILCASVDSIFFHLRWGPLIPCGTGLLTADAGCCWTAAIAAVR